MVAAVHNVHIRRADGTSGAERFFGCAESLFARVLQRVPQPARRQPLPPTQPYLTPVAALRPAVGLRCQDPEDD
jgi:hypothetical protein